MKLKIPNKKYIFGIAITTIIISIFTIGLINIIMTSKVSTQLKTTAKIIESEAEIQVAAIPKLPSKVLYRLYECGGKIGIYDAQSNILVDIIDVLASTLPKSDRAALKKGIDIYTFADLAKIIDDFTS